MKDTLALVPPPASAFGNRRSPLLGIGGTSQGSFRHRHHFFKRLKHGIPLHFLQHRLPALAVPVDSLLRAAVAPWMPSHKISRYRRDPVHCQSARRRALALVHHSLDLPSSLFWRGYYSGGGGALQLHRALDLFKNLLRETQNGSGSPPLCS
jgi:hypothetical protein